MVKSSPEKLASALRANLKRRKGAVSYKSPPAAPADAPQSPATPPQSPGPEQS